jgi:hypothetical protein
MNISNIIGRTSEYLTGNDLSKRLIGLVASDALSKTGKMNQSIVAKMLKVSQPFIHSVLYKNKCFDGSKFMLYCKNNHLEIDELMSKLMNIKNESNILESLASAARMPCDKMQAVYDLYEETHEILDKERRITAQNNSTRSFDIYRAFSAILSFLCNGLCIENHPVLSAGIVLQEGSRKRTIWSTRCPRQNDLVVSRCLDNDDVFINWISSCAHGRKIQPEVIHSEEIPSNILEASSLTRDIEENFTIVINDAYVNVSDYAEAMWYASCIAIIRNTVAKSVINKAKSMHCAIRLIDKVIHLAKEDEIRCMEVMLDCRLDTRDYLRGAEARKSDIEVAEYYTQNILNKICNIPMLKNNLATCDIWAYQVSTRSFISPTDGFRKINPRNSDFLVSTSEGELPLHVVFKQEYEAGRLEPRPIGKTRHMIASRRALVLNKKDNYTFSKVWSSSLVLELGTFIGIPFIFRPTGKDGASFLSALYIRFLSDMTPDEARDAISEIVWIMQSEKMQNRFEPLIRLHSIDEAERPSLGWQQFQDSERGIWYEVDASITDSNLDTTPPSKPEVVNVDRSPSAQIFGSLV